MTLQLNRQAEPIKMRNYGRIVQDTIAYATTLEPGVERDSLEIYIAQCMRQRNLVWNRDQETGLARVREDIIRLSDGKLRCESAAFMQMMAQPNTPVLGQRKKKK
ncbi:MAG: DUF4290 domain-containing protein [Paludibacteraceae bacterium]|nr:DUF4290 domain-containing protein [Paludibacteraceae bacterium]